MQFVITYNQNLHSSEFELLNQSIGGLSIFSKEERKRTFIYNKAIVSESKGLVLYGHCYDKNYKELSALELLSFFKAEQYDIVNELHGVFCLLYFDLDTYTAICCSDRFGIMPVYYYYDNETMIFSDNVSEIYQIANTLNKKLSINYAGIAQFLFYGNPIGDSSYFNEVKRLREGELIKLNTLLFTYSNQEYGNLLDFSIDLSITEDQVVSTVISKMKDGTKKLAELVKNKQKVLTLSGGWDSRFIGELLKQASMEVKTLTTYGDDGHDQDQVYGYLTSRRLGFNNEFTDINDNYYLTYLEEYLNETNYETSLHVWMKNFIKELDIKEPTFNFDGIAGDRFLKSFMERGLPEIDSVEIIDQEFTTIYQHFKLKDQFELLLTNTSFNQLEELAKQSLKDELQRYKGHPNSYTLFLLNNRTRRNIGYTLTELQGEKLIPLLPFLYNPFVNYMLTVPPNIRKSVSLYPKILSELNQQIAEIPSTNDKESSKLWNERTIFKHKEQVLDRIECNLQQNKSELFNVQEIKVRFEEVRKEPGLLRTMFKSLERTNILSMFFEKFNQVTKLEHASTEYNRSLEGDSHPFHEQIIKDGKQVVLGSKDRWSYFGSNRKGFKTIIVETTLPANYKDYLITCNDQHFIDRPPNQFDESNQSYVYSGGKLYLTLDNKNTNWSADYIPTEEDIKTFVNQHEINLYYLDPNSINKLDSESWRWRVIQSGNKQILNSNNVSWSYFGSNRKGFKTMVASLGLDKNIYQYIVTKNDNELSKENPSKFASGDYYYLHQNGNLYVSVDNKLSHWPIDYVPNQDDIDEYFKQNEYVFYMYK